MIVNAQPISHPLHGKHIMTSICDGMSLEAVMIRLKIVDDQLDRLNHDREVLEAKKDALIRMEQIDWVKAEELAKL